MRNLLLPEGMTSISVFDQTFSADENGALRDVHPDVAREIMAMDPRVKLFTPDGADDPVKMNASMDRRAKLLAKVPALDRTEMFAVARSIGVSLPATMSNEKMREALATQIASAPEDKLPLTVGTMKNEEGAVVSTLTPAEQASVNKGNDALGTKAAIDQHDTSGGATFHQGSGVPAALNPAARPAPAGLGPVSPTGTQQPPFNQLNTETGAPSHDADMARYPIATPPIDPLTGQPYREGDPRIPASAKPMQRTETSPGEQSITGAAPSPAAAAVQDAAVAQADGDAHAKNLGDALNAVSSDLRGASDTGGPLFSPEQQAERDAAAKAAQDTADAAQRKAGQIAGDANHGNDTEGKIPPDAPIKH